MHAAMKPSALTLGEKLAAAAGALLLVDMVVLDWYRSEAVGNAPATEGDQASFGANAFQAFEFVDLLLLVLAIAAIAIAVVRVLGSASEGGSGQTLLGTGLVAFLLILFRFIVPPGDTSQAQFEVTVSPELGVYVGLGLAFLVALGGYLALRQQASESAALTRAADAL